MPANKRIRDLSDYTAILPYASEMFGVYQPLIGWKSKRILQRMNRGISNDLISSYKNVLNKYKGILNLNQQPDARRRVMMMRMQQTEASVDAPVPDIVQIGTPITSIAKPPRDAVLLKTIADILNENEIMPENEQWKEYINAEYLKTLLNTKVLETYEGYYNDQVNLAHKFGDTSFDALKFENELIEMLKVESAIAGALLEYANKGLFEKITALFFQGQTQSTADFTNVFDSIKSDFKDPYLTFDPKKDIQDVSLSPIGIVHLYRQYFFELDTFLGTPTSHVWLSPGSSVELVEISTRKTLTEKTFETSLESITKNEKNTTDQEDISNAVKEDNKKDTKIGFTATINQSWGTGSLSATGSLNIDKTQQVAREHSDKRMKQQSAKLSTEIRQNFKSTFKTSSESIDTSSKRYVLSNTTQNLINYELRRKMRQVGVQIQDIGSYLCWETFVDEPGKQLGLADLIHIAQPADLVMVPEPQGVSVPPETVSIGFTGEMTWLTPNNALQLAEQHPEVEGRFVPFNTLEITGIPDGYELAIPPNPNDPTKPNPFVPIVKTTIAADGDSSWAFANDRQALGRITDDKKYIQVGIITPPGGLTWDKLLTWKVSGSVICKLTEAKKNEIAATKLALDAAKAAIINENQRKQQEAYVKAANDRVTLASTIKKRKFEDLREEERTIVYRNLIKSLMTEQNYENLPEAPSGYEARHVLSELINSIFDIDKMLYFVAPEWWKPRKHSAISLGSSAVKDSINGSKVNWSGEDPFNPRDNYFITEKSEPAVLGSSLGWLLQLDGDDLRNTFLNAPWVKAVIPIRPGKELAAINWLQNVNVEGAEGLDANYAAPKEELDKIKEKLLANDSTDPVGTREHVTLNDAIRKLCLDVIEKEEASKIVGKYPKEEINDDNKVLATPIEKVYEHGFYPLKGGFKAQVEENFEVISQWIEVLPTDQMVPLEVKYDPRTGRQIVDIPIS